MNDVNQASKIKYSAKKEFLWVLISLLVGYFVNYLIFGKEALYFNQTLDINIHDTYFLVQNFGSICFFEAIFLFVIFLFRYIFFKGRNIWTGVWFLISIIASIVVNHFLISVIDSFVIFEMTSDNLNIGKKANNPVVDILLIWSKTIKFIQIGLLMLLSFIAFKIGVKYQMNKK